MKSDREEQLERQAPAYSWYALGVLFLVYLVNFVDRQILSILANDIQADLGIDDAQLGFLYGTAFAIFYALFGIPLGRLADGWFRVRLLGLGLTLWSAMTILSGLTRNISVLTVARVGVGVGEASANPCAYSLISDWFPNRVRATALSIYSAGLFVGSGLSLVLGGAIVDQWNAAFPSGGPLGLAGWQAAFITVGMPGILLAFWVLSLREPKRGAIDGLPTENRPDAWPDFARQILQIVPPFTLVGAALRGWRSLALNLTVALLLTVLALLATKVMGNGQQFGFVALGFYAVFSWASSMRANDRAAFDMTWNAPVFIGIVIVYSTISYIGYTFTYWAAPYAERSFALGKTELGLLVGAPNALGGFIGVIAGGWAADRMLRRLHSGRMMIPAIALVAVIPLVLLGYSTGSLATFLICNFLSQMATASALGACAAASQALVLPRLKGVATAVFLLGPTLLGLGFGPFTAGYISEATGSLSTGVIASLIVALPGLLVLAFVVRSYPSATSALAKEPS